jgi:hypothetical protein
MINKITHTLKRLIQKKYISYVRKLNPQLRKSAYERDCMLICKKLIGKEETILLLTPITNKRYIRNEKQDIFVILENYSVKVINHVYSYTIFLEDKSWNSIVALFDNEVEERRLVFEKEITANIRHSLQNILKTI